MSEKRKVLGTDLLLRLDEEGADLVLSSTGDLATVVFESNLGQAIMSRLRTRIGELRELGHEALGSRLYEFVGEPNNLRTRELVRAAVKESLLREPRVREITRIEVTSNRNEKDRVDIEISIVPIGQEVPLNIVIPFYLEVA